MDADHRSPAVADWTLGPARWVAVAILASASIAGLAWSIRTQQRIEQAQTLDPARRIDLNRAHASELELLPGIGPSLARAIVEDRAANGPFASLDDLQRVDGIGPRTVVRVRPFVVIGPADP